MRGFNTHLTRCCPRGAVELTRRLSTRVMSGDLTSTHFWKRGQQRGTVSFFRRNGCFRASTPFEVCGSFQVSLALSLQFLNLAECDVQCSDKVTGILIGSRKWKCIHVKRGMVEMKTFQPICTSQDLAKIIWQYNYGGQCLVLTIANIIKQNF